MKFILGKKLKMSQIFDEKRNVIPVVLIEAGPCYITQIKTKEKDKYTAIQIGFEKLKSNKVKNPQRNVPYRHLKEYRNEQENVEELKVGEKLDASIFKEGDKVSVSGISKGKGFAGAVKKWGFKGGCASHGVKHTHRTLGSIGSMFPQRVIKGKKMPGRMGFERTTVKNLTIAKIDLENNVIAVKGAVPGRRGTLLEIKSMNNK
ncbi:MAG: 50S ribosomal protein L3 [Patescibacteria group bacterium]|nr:50S ribosomal protein L3 [Patescibacteria group bacterium]